MNSINRDWLGIVMFFGGAYLGAISPASAAFPEAYPGSIWNRTNYDFENIEGFGNEGNLNQGVQWYSFTDDISVSTFAAYRWRLRTLNATYYDAHGPALGVEFSVFFIKLGTEFEWQNYPRLKEHSNNFSLYSTWFKRFDFFAADGGSILGIPILGAPTFTWGRLSNDFGNIEGLGSMGFLSQGIDWFSFPGDIIFRTFALYSWRFRTENARFYNVHGPGIGAELAWETVSLGAEYDWLNYTNLQERSHTFRAYLTFFFDWDLRGISGQEIANRSISAR